MGHRQPAELPNIMFGMLGTFIIILVINWEKYSIGCHTCHRVLPWLCAGGANTGKSSLLTSILICLNFNKLQTGLAQQ